MTLLSPSSRVELFTALCRQGTIAVSGDSMEPTLHNGDRVVVDVDATPRVGEVAVFVGDDDHLVVHRLVARRGDRRHFLGDNRRALDPVVDRTYVVGVATAIATDDGPRPLARAVGPMSPRLWGRVAQGCIVVMLARLLPIAALKGLR